MRFKNTVCKVILLAHVGKLLAKLSITDLYAYFIFVEFLHYKVLILFLCGLLCVNSLLILTNLPYNSNSTIQGGCQFLLQVCITDLYEYCLFFEHLC